MMLHRHFEAIRPADGKDTKREQPQAEAKAADRENTERKPRRGARKD